MPPAPVVLPPVTGVVDPMAMAVTVVDLLLVVLATGVTPVVLVLAATSAPVVLPLATGLAVPTVLAPVVSVQLPLMTWVDLAVLPVTTAGELAVALAMVELAALLLDMSVVLLPLPALPEFAIKFI